ncbi:hypothetical protein QOT17_004303 [Balamuthia mandrillaris]
MNARHQLSASALRFSSGCNLSFLPRRTLYRTPTTSLCLRKAFPGSLAAPASVPHCHAQHRRYSYASSDSMAAEPHSVPPVHPLVYGAQTIDGWQVETRFTAPLLDDACLHLTKVMGGDHLLWKRLGLQVDNLSCVVVDGGFATGKTRFGYDLYKKVVLETKNKQNLFASSSSSSSLVVEDLIVWDHVAYARVECNKSWDMLHGVNREWGERELSARLLTTYVTPTLPSGRHPGLDEVLPHLARAGTNLMDGGCKGNVALVLHFDDAHLCPTNFETVLRAVYSYNEHQCRTQSNNFTIVLPVISGTEVASQWNFGGFHPHAVHLSQAPNLGEDTYQERHVYALVRNATNIQAVQSTVLEEIPDMAHEGCWKLAASCHASRQTGREQQKKATEMMVEEWRKAEATFLKVMDSILKRELDDLKQRVGTEGMRKLLYLSLLAEKVDEREPVGEVSLGHLKRYGLLELQKRGDGYYVNMSLPLFSLINQQKETQILPPYLVRSCATDDRLASNNTVPIEAQLYSLVTRFNALCLLRVRTSDIHLSTLRRTSLSPMKFPTNDYLLASKSQAFSAARHDEPLEIKVVEDKIKEREAEEASELQQMETKKAWTAGFIARKKDHKREVDAWVKFDNFLYVMRNQHKEVEQQKEEEEEQTMSGLAKQLVKRYPEANAFEILNSNDSLSHQEMTEFYKMTVNDPQLNTRSWMLITEETAGRLLRPFLRHNK